MAFHISSIATVVPSLIRAPKQGTYCIAYGALTNYEVPVFSPVEIAKSTDYKFKDGIISYKAFRVYWR